mgnify:CR=1 FL=1
MTTDMTDVELAWKNAFNVQDKYKTMSVEEIKKCADSDRLPYAVVCLNLEKDINISSIVRTSHAMGAENVFAIGWRKVDARGMVGCQHYTNYHKIRVTENNINEVIVSLKDICEQFGYTPMFSEWNEYSKPLNGKKCTKFIKNHRPLLIMGNENGGIPDEIMKAFKYKNIFHIKQRGVIRSINVSNASAMMQYKINDILG